MKYSLHARRLIRALTEASDKGPRLWVIVAAAITLAAAAITAYNGAVTLVAPWDVFALLDGGWRIHIGHVPHRDFYNPVGPLTYQLIAFGMSIAQPSTVSISLGVLVFLLVIAPWAWFVCSHRLTGFLAAIFTAYVSLLVIAARPLGYEPEVTTYAMLYNRFGWALISTLFIQIFVAPRRSNGFAHVLEGVSIGVLLGLLFYCKVNYVGIALMGVGVAHVFRPDLRSSFPYQAMSFVAVCATWWLTFDINPFAYVADLRAAVGAQSIGHRITYLTNSVRENIWTVYVLVVLCVGTLLVRSKENEMGRGNSEPVRFVVTLVFLLAATFFIATGNAPEGKDLPLLFVAEIVLLQSVSDQIDKGSRDSLSPTELIYLLTLAIGLPLLAGHTLAKDVLSVAHATRWRDYKASSASAAQRFESVAIADFVVPHTSEWRTAYWRAKEVPDRINDGLRLLRRHVSYDSRIFTMAFANPFPFALQLPPPKGSALWWDLNFSVSGNELPSPQAVFEDVDIVIVPRLRASDDGCCSETIRRMLETYDPYLDQHFPEVHRSDYWILRQRKNGTRRDGSQFRATTEANLSGVEQLRCLGQ